MTTQKRKGSKKKRSKKYRGGGNSSDSIDTDSSDSRARDADSIIIDDLSKELDDLVDPYKKAKMWNNLGYAATILGLATAIGIVVLKNVK